jgi:Family of unknown function (DUF6272)
MKNEMIKPVLLVSFSGVVSQEAIADIVSRIENDVLKSEVKRSFSRRLISACVEMMQNSLRHGIAGEQAYFTLEDHVQQYRLACVNKATHAQASSLDRYLKLGKTVPEGRLREEIISLSLHGKSLTAGTGIFMILDASENQTVYHEIKNEDYSLVHLECILRKNQNHE